ncbi:MULTISPECIES: hypothetical protein [Hafnia]|uniref:hypothetical protein n=1 Tax=Hafnia TaxID=568 RepID=UPI000E026B6B|nr:MULTISPECIES: hypothetical protein [Hafnia]STQ70476.1 Uncharacterised protein [Hafnia alvei]
MKFLVMLLLVPCFSYAGTMSCESYASGDVINDVINHDTVITGKARTVIYYTDKTAGIVMGKKTFTGFNWNEKSQLYRNNVGAYLLVQEDEKMVTVQLMKTMWIFTDCEIK